MKNIFKLVGLIISITLLSFTNFTKKSLSDSYNVNTEKSKVEFVGVKKSNYHTGFIPLKSGSVQIENGKLVGGEFILDMANTKVTDGTDRLGQHLLAPDFFDIAKFPVANFKINKVSYLDKNECNIEGTLNCKGISIAINLKATVQSADEKDGFFAHAYFSLDRSLLGINYGIGAGNIDKQVQLAIYIFAKK